MLWKGVHGRAKLTGAWWPESKRERKGMRYCYLFPSHDMVTQIVPIRLPLKVPLPPNSAIG